MKFNFKDIVSFNNGSGLIKSLIIGLWKSRTATNWEQLLCAVDKNGFNLSKSHMVGWIKNGGQFLSCLDIDNYMDKMVDWINPVDIIAIYPSSNKIIEQPTIATNDSMFCKTCTNQAYMAEPNQADGSFICFTCRKYPIRQYY